MKNAALWYAKYGLSVIPIRPNKKPYIQWAKHQESRPTNQQIESWWEKWPKAGIGIVTGPISGVDVIDVDSAAGHEALNEFLPETLHTPVSRTPGGGWHYYFRHKPGLVNKARVLADCDIRTTGGYIIAPPSKNSKGEYKFMPKCMLGEIPLADMPDVLFDVLQQGGKPGARISTHSKNSINTDYRGALLQIVTTPAHICQQMPTFLLKKAGVMRPFSALLTAW